MIRRPPLHGKSSRSGWAEREQARERPSSGSPSRSIVSEMKTIPAEALVGEEWAEGYRLSPEERWRETCRLWEWFLEAGGSLDPEPDTQSPFFDPEARHQSPVDERAGPRVVRRSGV